MAGRVDGTGAPGTRDRILIAAATMLGEDPTARLSVRAVAARAQVSTGSLRHFFPTQRELIDTVIAGLYDVEVPDDPIRDAAIAPAERLVACLRQLLALIGAGVQAREHWRALYDAYIVTPPSEDDAETYRALERLTVHRIERWLGALIDPEIASEVEIGHRSRFLATVVTGLATERALPADPRRVDHESQTLRRAAHAALGLPAPL